VDQPDVIVGCRLRLYKIVHVRDAGAQQILVDHPVFLGRKNVFADRQVIRVTVDKPEGQHGGEPLIILKVRQQKKENSRFSSSRRAALESKAAAVSDVMGRASYRVVRSFWEAVWV
jgi:hypothetical protein